MSLLSISILVLVLIPGLAYGYYHQDYQILVSPLWLPWENEFHVINVYIWNEPQNLTLDVKNNIRYDLKQHLHVIPLYLVQEFPEHSINNEQTGCINGKVYGCLTDENIIIINGHQYDKVGDISLLAHLIKRVYEKDMIW